MELPSGLLATAESQAKRLLSLVAAERLARDRLWSAGNTPRNCETAINKRFLGPIAQLGARLNGIEKVVGSNPTGSTED